MPYSGEGVQALVCALDDMKSANVIYVESSLQRVLKCLAYYNEFRDALAYCNKGFDYQAEKEKAYTRINDDNVLLLPKSKKNLVALVANLLLEFDRNTSDLVTFVNTFFPSENKQTSFNFFFDGVMVPFKLALVDIVVNGVDEEPKIVERSVDFAPSGLQQQTEYWLLSIFDTVRSGSLDEELRSQFTVMLEGLAAALDARDSLMIRAIWLGLKGALENAKLCKKEIAKIDDALRLYIVSK